MNAGKRAPARLPTEPSGSRLYFNPSATDRYRALKKNL